MLRGLDLLVFAAMGSLLPSAALLTRRFPMDVRARYAMGFVLGLLAFLALPVMLRLKLPRLLILAGLLLQVGNTFFFWMFTMAAVRDRFRSRWYHWLVLGFKVVIAVLSLWPERPFLIRDLSAGEKLIMSWFPPALFSVILVALSLHQVARGLRDDLVEERKRTRITVLIVGAITILLIIIIRLSFHGEKLNLVYEAASAAIVLILSLFFTMRFVRIDRAFLGDEDESPSATTPVDEQLLARLRQLFETEHYYREEGLTIRGLSEKLEEPEYRLRKLINGGLGYRNFNDFVNRYRIQEACEILLDPDKDDIPVLRISMDLGYRSLGGFNKSFKDLTGTTPTAYRKSGGKGAGNPSP